MTDTIFNPSGINQRQYKAIIRRIADTSPADQGIQAAREEAADAAIEQRAAEQIQLWDTDLILAALGTASRDTFMGRILRGEMISRGFGAAGLWIGHDAAREFWTP